MDAQAPAPSPFLPGTNVQYAWDSTSLGYLKTCPRLYQYIMIEGWAPKEESVHLRFGIEYHQALQEYDLARATGTRHEDAVREAIGNLYTRTFSWDTDPDTKAGRYKNRTSLIQLVLDYLDNFGPDDPAQTVIKSDGAPAVEESFRFELDWGPVSGEAPYLLCGHLDRIVEFNGQVLVMDRKTTTTTLSSYYFDQYEPNNQMTLYTLAGGVVLDSPIKGVIIDAAQIMLDKPNRFVRGFTYRTEDQLIEWLESLRYTLVAAENYARMDYWPMNDTSCDKFGGCRFRQICSKSPGVREAFLKADFVKAPPEERWNPLRTR